MTDGPNNDSGVVGSLRVTDGVGAVRMEVRLAAPAAEVWSALTDPARLGRWYGEVTGELRAGGEYQAHVLASGWEGSGRIEVCEPGHRLVVSGAEPGEEYGITTEVTLTADSAQTLLVCEERGMPAALVAAYGAGVQIHVEDLAAHLAGRERAAAEPRWDELEPHYTKLAADLG